MFRIPHCWMCKKYLCARFFVFSLFLFSFLSLGWYCLQTVFRFELTPIITFTQMLYTPKCRESWVEMPKSTCTILSITIEVSKQDRKVWVELLQRMYMQRCMSTRSIEVAALFHFNRVSLVYVTSVATRLPSILEFPCEEHANLSKNFFTCSCSRSWVDSIGLLFSRPVHYSRLPRAWCSWVAQTSDHGAKFV